MKIVKGSRGNLTQNILSDYIASGFAPSKSTLYQYVLPGKRPFAVVCPGGGYNMIASATEGRPYARALNAADFSAFVLHYRVRKAGKYPAPQDDLAEAIRDIIDRADELGVSKRGYSVWGSSAGGHLAATFGVAETGYLHYGLPRPAALVLAYPVITMASEYTHARSRSVITGGDPRLEDLLSVEKHVTASFPPTYIWNSPVDKVVDFHNGFLLAEALARQNVDCEYHQYAFAPHGIGLGLGTEAEPWFDEAIAFWQRHR